MPRRFFKRPAYRSSSHFVSPIRRYLPPRSARAVFSRCVIAFSPLVRYQGLHGPFNRERRGTASPDQAMLRARRKMTRTGHGGIRQKDRVGSEEVVPDRRHQAEAQVRVGLRECVPADLPGVLHELLALKQDDLVAALPVGHRPGGYDRSSSQRALCGSVGRDSTTCRPSPVRVGEYSKHSTVAFRSPSFASRETIPSGR